MSSRVFTELLDGLRTEVRRVTGEDLPVIEWTNDTREPLDRRWTMKFVTRDNEAVATKQSWTYVANTGEGCLRLAFEAWKERRPW